MTLSNELPDTALDLPGGAELFVLEGAFTENGEEFVESDWLRLLAGSSLRATAGT